MPGEFYASVMSIKTNIKDLRPAKEKYCREVELLSKGYFNRAAFPDGKITVLPWDSSVDDWIARRLQKGGNSGRSLLFQVLPKVCNLNGCKVDDFIASEVMLILMVSRSILHRDAVTYEAVCPECDFHSPTTVKIPDQLEKVAEKPGDYPGYDQLTLPECQDIVQVRPLTIKDELDVVSRPEDVRQRTLPDQSARVLTGIMTVGGGKPENLMELVGWFNALPPGDSEFLAQEFDKIQPELSRTVKHKCDACEHEFSHILQLNEEFFRRGGTPESRKQVAPAGNPSLQKQGTPDKPVRRAGSDPAKAA